MWIAICIWAAIACLIFGVVFPHLWVMKYELGTKDYLILTGLLLIVSVAWPLTAPAMILISMFD